MKSTFAGIMAVMCGFCLGQARGASITYTLSGTATGILGSTSFTNAAYTITSIADTTQVTNSASGVFSVNDSSATVNVSGIGTATFLIPTTNFANQNLPAAGISSLTLGEAILFDDSPAFATYDLRSSIGPISGSPSFNPGSPFATTLGNFQFDSVSSVTFQATTQAVPEPVSLMMMGLGIGGVGLFGCSRRRGNRCHFIFRGET